MKNNEMKIPKNVSEAIARLESGGFEAFCVGGCVRDFVLGKVPTDFDITTSARPEETLEIFKNYNLFTNGIKHGTVSVIIENEVIEITSYRVDGEYKDNRHPESVRFSRSLGDDLSRRDFTVNAMAYSPKCGIVDLFGGENDIKNATIKCVGNPDKRFNEDSLRILRALRFCSVLGFKTEQKTKESILKNLPLIHNVSAERIYAEFIKMINGKNLYSVLKDFPSLTETLFGFTLTPRKLSAIKKLKNPEQRLAVIFLNEDIIVFKKLKPDNKTYSGLKRICKNYKLRLTKNDLSEKKIKLFLLKNSMSSEDFCELIELKSALVSALDTKKFLKFAKKIISEKQPYCVPHLNIDGSDLAPLGFKGKAVKNALNTAITAVINEKISNQKSEILHFLEENMKEKAE